MHNETYKMADDSHHRHVELSIGDYVMVHIRPERFRKGSAKKLKARNAGPSKVVKRMGSNGCVLELPTDWKISPLFNVEDLVLFRGPTTLSHYPQVYEPVNQSINDPDTLMEIEPYEPTHFEPNLPSPTPALGQKKEFVEDTLDEALVSTRHGGYQKQLANWKDRLVTDSTWIPWEEL